jgi:hypothetical protein
MVRGFESHSRYQKIELLGSIFYMKNPAAQLSQGRRGNGSRRAGEIGQAGAPVGVHRIEVDPMNDAAVWEHPPIAAEALGIPPERFSCTSERLSKSLFVSLELLVLVH